MNLWIRRCHTLLCCLWYLKVRNTIELTASRTHVIQRFIKKTKAPCFVAPMQGHFRGRYIRDDWLNLLFKIPSNILPMFPVSNQHSLSLWRALIDLLWTVKKWYNVWSKQGRESRSGSLENLLWMPHAGECHASGPSTTTLSNGQRVTGSRRTIKEAWTGNPSNSAAEGVCKTEWRRTET